MIDYTPPIEERPTEQLKDIVAHKKKWRDDVVARAEVELGKRGVSLAAARKGTGNGIRGKRKMSRIKTKAGYSGMEKLGIVLLGPLLFLLLNDLFPFHTGKGPKKKNRQAIIYQLLGIIFWGVVIWISIDWGV